jgi:lysophospholipase L1-like esterase
MWIYSDVVDQFHLLMEEYCLDQARLTFVNVTSAQLGEHGRPIGDYYVGDGVHLNASGYLQWVKVLHSVPYLLSLVYLLLSD